MSDEVIMERERALSLVRRLRRELAAIDAACARIEERAGVMPDDPPPWVKAGVSRATWYRWQRERKQGGP